MRLPGVCHPGNMSLDPRSPSMNLWHWLLAHGASEDEATELMNGYAHELAERVRGWAATQVGGEIEEIYGYAADLIDPQSDDFLVDEYRPSTRPGAVSGRE
jgi:hypothetical protein